MANDATLIRFEVCIYKNDDVPYDEFIEWATKTYPPQAIPIMKKHGMVKWTQTVTPPHFREPFRQTLKNDMGRPEWTVPDYDLVHAYYLRNMDDMKAVTMEPKWNELEETAQKMAKMSIGQVVIGHETVHFEDNKS